MITKIILSYLKPLLLKEHNPKVFDKAEEFYASLKDFAKLGMRGCECAKVKLLGKGYVPIAGSNSSPSWIGRVVEWFFPTQLAPGAFESFFRAFIQKNEQHLLALPPQKVVKHLKYLHNHYGNDATFANFLLAKIQSLSQPERELFTRATSILVEQKKIQNDCKVMELRQANRLRECVEEYKRELECNEEFPERELKSLVELLDGRERGVKAQIEKHEWQIENLKSKIN